jgi:glycosyltransferase involved in cell wall biosynthesis
MRVLAMTNLYPNPFQPNRATFNRHQFRILAERHPVRVIAPILWTDERAARRNGHPPLPPDRRVMLDGLTVDHPRYVYTPKVGRRWYGRWFAWSVRKAFETAVVEHRPDVVLAPWAYPDGWAAVRLARRFNLPVVIQCHGSDVLALDQHPARKRLTAEAVAAAAGVVAVSRDIADHLAALGVPADRVRVILDGVDRSVFCPGDQAEARRRVGVSPGEPMLLFVGGLLPVKAVDVLLNAAARLVADGTPVRLLVIGDGPQRTKLQSLAAELGLGERVRFVGAIPHADLPDWYRAADLFVLPSHSEGVPNVLLEASACGTPWVASNVGGIPEIAHLGVSRRVPPNRPEELANAIRDALAASPSPHPPGPKSRHEAVDELIDFLTETLNRHRHVSESRSPKTLARASG